MKISQSVVKIKKMKKINKSYGIKKSKNESLQMVKMKNSKNGKVKIRERKCRNMSKCRNRRSHEIKTNIFISSKKKVKNL